MSDDLLAKEREFHRLNRELQLRVQEVTKDVDSVIHAFSSDNLFGNKKHRLPPAFETKDAEVHGKDAISKMNKQSKELSDKVPETLMTDDNPTKIKDVSLKHDNSLGNRAVINLLNTKIDMLYKELQEIQQEYNKKCDYSKELQTENKKNEGIQVKLHNQIESLSNTITKIECTNSDTLSKCEALSNENAALKKELNSLKKEVKILNQQSTSYDVRLNRSLESNEKLRNTLKSNQVEEKELRNQIRKLQEDKRLAVKNLEKQRLELVQAFKKQTLLVDNLKKQNMYLIANGQIRLLEEDFAKLLEWKPQKL